MKSDALIKAKLKSNMILFGKTVMPNMFSSASPQFHFKIASILQDLEEKQINIIAPRGHAKSSLVGGIFPLYHLMFDEGPKLIMLISRTQDHAIKLLGTIKDTLDFSPNFRSLFGYWGMNSARSWAKAEVELKDGSVLMCKGTGQQLRGIKVGNQRPTLIVVDDPEDENNTKTAEAMETNLRWLLQSAVPSLDPMRGRIAVIGTPQHQRCLVETLKDMKGWHNMHFSPDMANRKALWEEWQPIKRLEAKKEELESIGRVSVFYREYLCEIVGDEDQLFKPAYIKSYKGKFYRDEDENSMMEFSEIEGQEYIKNIPVNIFMGVDPASSIKRSADYSAIVTIAIDKKGNRYVLPYYQKRATPMNLAEAIIEQFKIYKPDKVRIESVGYQEMLREYLKTRCEEENLFIPGLEIKEIPRNSKSIRLEQLQPYFAQGKFYLLDDMTALKDELIMFPRGKHDDLLDGLFYANKKTYAPTHGVINKEEERKSKNNSFKSIDWMTS